MFKYYIFSEDFGSGKVFTCKLGVFCVQNIVLNEYH